MKFIDFGRFQTGSVELFKILESVPSLAAKRNPIFIMGEKGTGRRLFAEYIHDKGPAPFRGIIRWRPPFSGQIWTSVGFGDTVLVDQIHSFSEEQVDELWEIIQEVHRKVGPSGVQWIFTCDTEAMRQCNFQQHKSFVDWMNFSYIKVPSLRERGDARNLSEFVLEMTCLIAGKAKKAFTAEALARIESYPWPGNVAELEDVIEKAVRQVQGVEVAESALVISEKKPPESKLLNINFKLPSMTLEEIEQKLILQTLDLTQNNKTQAAKLLGISIRTLRNKLTIYREAGIYESDVR